MSAPALAVQVSVPRESETKSKLQNPQPQDIANLAYTLWQQRGCPEGSPEQDWSEAERIMRNEKPPTLARR